MIHSIMLYGVVLGLMLAGAAHFMDLGLRALGRPTRWTWAGAMAVTALLPLASPLFPQGSGNAASSGAAIPMDTLYDMWDGAALSGSGGTSLLETPNGPLLLAWLTASLLLAVLFVGTALRLRRQARVWSREEVGGEDVLISDGLGPAVLGLLFPRIVLPPWALSLEAEELEMVLLHEAEHRKTRDPALLAGGILAVALAPWNPALWWGLGRLRLAVEADCDRRVLTRGVHRKSYGRLLLGVASGARDLFPLAPALAEGGGTRLERRLRMMRDSVGKRKLGAALAAVAAGGFFLALACETPTPPQAGVETVKEPSAVVKGIPASDPEATWTFTEGGHADAALTGENVLLERITEDGTLSAEAGQARFLSEDRVTLENGLKIRVGEPPAGAREVMEAEPLILIDGVIVQEGNAKAIINDLDPDLIDSIEVIKGKAAEALYGERAAAGVIQIRTKK
jgi:TonB-dependent SusC/RagA subfamily outer membrane receptor